MLLVFVVISCCFHIEWGLVAEGSVSPFWVVESLDVFENYGGGPFVCWEYVIAEPFSFQATEEAFHGPVVPAVTFGGV